MAEQKGANKMSKHSLNIAVKYGETLREFCDQSEAEDYYISYKDNLLNRLKAISTQSSAFFPDYTVESLKRLEKSQIISSWIFWPDGSIKNANRYISFL